MLILLIQIQKKKAGQTSTDGTKIMVSLQYLCNFSRTLEMPIISCELKLIIIN